MKSSSFLAAARMIWASVNAGSERTTGVAAFAGAAQVHAARAASAAMRSAVSALATAGHGSGARSRRPHRE